MKKLELYNIRLGFAANSSSSHSLIIIPGAKDKYQDDDDAIFGEFGWNFFTAVSRETKSLYFAGLLYKSVCYMLDGEFNRFEPNREALSIVSELVGVEWGGGLEEDEGELSFRNNNYIDHQSMVGFPFSWDGGSLHMGFIEEFKEFILQDDLVILGGNDNTDESHPLLDDVSSEGNFDFSLPHCFSGQVVRKDPKNGFWTSFSRKTGAKSRFEFIEQPYTHQRESRGTSFLNWSEHRLGKGQVLAASVPELLDLSITSWCDQNCSACYQSATTEGVSAPLDRIKGLLDLFAELQVFEVVIGGGGEPTSHPNFAEIVSYCRELGIVPNVSTKSLEWFKSSGVIDVLGELGGCGYSVSSADEVYEFVKTLEETFKDETGTKRVYNSELKEYEEQVIPYDFRKKAKFSFHCIMGSMPLDEFKEIVEAAAKSELGVVLLGYKSVGRGAKISPYDYSGWFDVVKEVRGDFYFRVAIDTSLAAESVDVLEKARVPNWVYEKNEGAFSCYVDAVSYSVAKSSYSGECTYLLNLKEMRTVLTNLDEWNDAVDSIMEKRSIGGSWCRDTDEGLFD